MILRGPIAHPRGALQWPPGDRGARENASRPRAAAGRLARVRRTPLNTSKPHAATPLRRAHDAALALTFVGMAAYEFVELRFLEAPRGAMAPFAVVVHALQVAVVLAAAYTVLRAWREKTAHEESLARMVEKVVFAQEEERRRIAYDLHDGVAPLIVSARQHVETSRDVSGADPARAAAELTRGVERLGQAIVEMRHVLRALRPSTIDADGLAAAVRRSLDEAARDAGWTVRFADSLGDEALPAAVETAAFRIVQEAITNAARHARATSLEVELAREAGSVRVVVRDRGVGFAVSAVTSRGLGLASMQERARLLGGACVVEGDPATGTTITAHLPLRAGVAP